MCTKKSHENELLAFYCKKCKACVCDKCRRSRHNHHPTVDIHQAAEQRRADIEEIVEEMKKEIARYEEFAKSTRESLKKSREKITSVRNEVMTSVEELIRLLHDHEEAMITSLDKIERKEQREHEAKLQQFQGPINQIQNHIERFNGILQRKKSLEILQAHHDLIERCRGLINAEKPNIRKPSHARYKANKENMEKARSALLALGKVTVITTDPLTSNGIHQFELGSEVTFKTMINDADGNRCYNEQDLLDVEFQSPSGKVARHKIAPRKDGEYSVTYKPDYVGKHEVLIAVNGEPLTGSPWSVHVMPHPYKFVTSLFTKEGQRRCDFPSSIAIDDKSEKVAVTYYENRVQLFHLQGTYLTAEAQISTKHQTRPTSVAYTKSGELIVVASNKIACFDESYKFRKHVNNRHLKKPDRLSIAPDGRMVVCDSGYSAVKVLSSDGLRLLLTISDPDRVTPWYAVCHQNMFFVSYPESSIVKVFSENGVFLYNIGPSESGDGHLSSPVGFAIDRFNNLVVCDQHKARLQIFTLDGNLLNTIEGQHTGLTGPCSVAVSSTGQLFVTDLDRSCVYVFQ